MRLHTLFVGLGLTVVVGSGLAAGGSPAGAEVTPGQYVALGDSYSAGTGSGPMTTNCYRSTNAYPALYAADHPAMDFNFDACGGAVTGDVISKQLGHLSDATSLVTLTIGGNDIGFANIISTCAFGSDQVCLDKIEDAKANAYATLPDKLDATYGAIQTKAPHAKIVVLGYPHLLVDGPAWCSMSRTKRHALYEGVDLINEGVKYRAELAGLTFEDPTDEFAGHEVCSGSPWINGVKLDVVSSFHPNKAGQKNGYYKALQHALN